MATKHKKDYKWWIIGLVIVFVVILNIFISDNPVIRSIFKKPYPTPTPTPKPVEILPPQGLATDQAEYVKMAIDKLVDKLKIERNKITVVKVAPYEFSDSSLGCPEKDKFYTQVITSGYKMELKTQGKIYKYNAGLNRVVSC